MKRIAVLLLAVLIAVPTAALAEPASSPDADPAGARPALEVRPVRPSEEGGLRAAVAALRVDADTPESRGRRDVGPADHEAAMAATRTVAQPGRKSFWRTPWPYVLIGGAAVVLVIAAARGDGY